MKAIELNNKQRKRLTQPVSFALIATALSNCGGGADNKDEIKIVLGTLKNFNLFCKNNKTLPFEKLSILFRLIN